jgi:uncharacterized protein YjbJ (UPF0337 family)
MNWDRLEGEWKQRRGKAVRHWGRVMNDELAAAAGKYEELVGRLQEKFGISSEESKRHFDEFRKVVGQLKKSNAELMTLQVRFKKAKSATGKARLTKAHSKAARSKIRGAPGGQHRATRIRRTSGVRNGQ